MKKKKLPVISKHVLIPKHSKLSDKEKKELLEKYNITLNELPRIPKEDPAIISLSTKPGDIIKITRASKTAGTSAFYRGIVNV